MVAHTVTMQKFRLKTARIWPQRGKEKRELQCHMQKQAGCVYSDANQAGHCVPPFHAGCFPELITTKVVLSPSSMNAAFEYTF